MSEIAIARPDARRELPPARPSWVRWRIVALLMAFAVMNHFNRVSMAVAHDAIRDDFCLSSTQIGSIISAFLLAYALCMTPGGWLIDRFGPRAALAFMGFGSALFGVCSGFAGYGTLALGLAFPSFLAIRALMGACSAPLHPAGARMVSFWVPVSRQAWANGLVTGAALVGVSSVHVIFGSLIDWCGWRVAFVVAGTCTGLLAVLWTAYAANHPGEHSSVNDAERRLIAKAVKPRPAAAESAGWHHLLLNRSLVLLTLSYAAVGYFEYLLFYWMAHYFREGLHLDVDQSRLYATIPPLAMVLTMPLGGLLSDRLVVSYGPRLGRALVPVGAMLASAAVLYAATNTLDPVWSLVWFTLAHGAIGATEGPFWTTAVDLGGPRGGTSAGICNTGGNAGGLVAPVLTPWVATAFKDWRLGMSLGSVVCLLGVVLWLWIDPSPRVQGEEPNA
jgi:ACS family D-galactonate transporter-like MFS transporter